MLHFILLFDVISHGSYCMWCAHINLPLLSGQTVRYFMHIMKHVFRMAVAWVHVGLLEDGYM